MKISISRNKREGRYLGKIAGVGHSRIGSFKAIFSESSFAKLLDAIKIKK